MRLWDSEAVRKNPRTTTILVMLLILTLVGAVSIGSEIYGRYRQESASGIGEDTSRRTARPGACQELNDAPRKEERRKNGETDEDLAFRNYCLALRANEIASANVVVSGWAAVFALMSLFFAVVAVVISVIASRAILDRSEEEPLRRAALGDRRDGKQDQAGDDGVD